MNNKRIKVITFESWVTTPQAFDYAIRNPEHVPFLLVDRSPCSDPFFDPFKTTDAERVAVIAGLCRGFVPRMGEDVLYITRLSNTARTALDRGDVRYLAVAHLKVERVFSDHASSLGEFPPNNYISPIRLTSRPPNIIGPEQPLVAMPRQSCLIRPDAKTIYTPEDRRSADGYLPNIEAYVRRSDGSGFGERTRKDSARNVRRKPVGVAVCKVRRLVLDWVEAPGFSLAVLPPDRGGKHSLNLNGRWSEREPSLASIGWF